MGAAEEKVGLLVNRKNIEDGLRGAGEETVHGVNLSLAIVDDPNIVHCIAFEKRLILASSYNLI